MNTIIQTIREKNLLPGFSSSSLSLPLSQSQSQSPADPGHPPQPGLRRRLSSLSLRIQQQVPSPGASWASFRRSRSVSSMGDYTGGNVTSLSPSLPLPLSWVNSILVLCVRGRRMVIAGGSIRKWWEQGWSWIMSRKTTLARDLEMSEEEGRVLGAQSKGSLRHLLFRVRSEIMKLVGSDANITLPR